MNELPDDGQDNPLQLDDDSTVAGFTSCCHVYIRRADDPKAFVHDLSHEMLHLNSFSEVSVKNAATAWSRRVWMSRKGYLRKSWGKPVEFSGFNEAATEMLAIIVRKLIEPPNVAAVVERLQVDRVSAYEPHVALARRLLSAIARRTGVDYRSVMRRLTQNYFDGELHFWILLDELLGEDGLNCLSSMTESLVSARQVTAELGRRFL